MLVQGYESYRQDGLVVTTIIWQVHVEDQSMLMAEACQMLATL